MAVPRSDERETKREPEMKTSPQESMNQRKPERQPEADSSFEQNIANLAYALWQRRGCPQGSPEKDWFQAEEIIRAGQKK